MVIAHAFLALMSGFAVMVALVMGLAALSALQSRGKQPIWIQLSLIAISPIGVLAGGLARLRVMGIL